jgi:hypothetical protein
MFILDGYSLDFKFARKNQFADGRRSLLLDISQNEYSQYISNCKEVDIHDLIHLDCGSIITYIRRDNKNIVRNARIMSHSVSRGCEPMTKVILDDGPQLVTRRDAARGYMYARGGPQYYINSDMLSRLFVVDVKALSRDEDNKKDDEIALLKDRIAALEELTSKQQVLIAKLIKRVASSPLLDSK